MDDSNDPRLIELLERVAAPALPQPAREQAFQALYDLTSSKMYGLAVRVVSNRDWAEDVLQEAYLQVWKVAGTYRSALSPPLAWLGILVRSRALDHLRRRAADRSHVTQELDAELADTLPGPGNNPMDTRQASEAAWALHECLRKLESRQRQVVSLAYLRDQSHSELAEQLSLPLGTVKTWIRRGLEQLRGCMSRYA